MPDTLSRRKFLVRTAGTVVAAATIPLGVADDASAHHRPGHGGGGTVQNVGTVRVSWVEWELPTDSDPTSTGWGSVPWGSTGWGS